MITQNRLREVVHYNPETGLFTWLNPPKGVKGIKGDVVGYPDSGYLCFRFEGENYPLHRLAVLYMAGEYPQGHVAHINEIKFDNRWVNLRVCSNTENSRNKGIQTNNKLGVKGLCLLAEKRRRPKIQGSVAYTEEGKKVILKMCRSFTEGDEKSTNKAVSEVMAWVRATREKYHGEFCNHGDLIERPEGEGL